MYRRILTKLQQPATVGATPAGNRVESKQSLIGSLTFLKRPAEAGIPETQVSGISIYPGVGVSWVSDLCANFGVNAGFVTRYGNFWVKRGCPTRYATQARFVNLLS